MELPEWHIGGMVEMVVIRVVVGCFGGLYGFLLLGLAG